MKEMNRKMLQSALRPAAILLLSFVPFGSLSLWKADGPGLCDHLSTSVVDLIPNEDK